MGQIWPLSKFVFFSLEKWTRLGPFVKIIKGYRRVAGKTFIEYNGVARLVYGHEPVMSSSPDRIGRQGFYSYLKRI